jgi:hypothetical protein
MAGLLGVFRSRIASTGNEVPRGEVERLPNARRQGAPELMNRKKLRAPGPFFVTSGRDEAAALST